nr:hypothetical protein [Tanacetum cinerariifolium]
MCLSDESLVISLDEIPIDDKLHLIEKPVDIMDREVTKAEGNDGVTKAEGNDGRGGGGGTTVLTVVVEMIADEGRVVMDVVAAMRGGGGDDGQRLARPWWRRRMFLREEGGYEKCECFKKEYAQNKVQPTGGARGRAYAMDGEIWHFVVSSGMNQLH